jgi:hypothetical protein
MRYIAWVSGQKAIVMLETPNRLALAEKIIADLAKSRPGMSLDAGNETGGVLRSRAVRNLAPGPAQLKISIDSSENARQAFERVAGMGGLGVTFDNRFQDGAVQRLAIKDVAIRDALDFLSLQTGSLWEFLTAQRSSSRPTIKRSAGSRAANAESDRFDECEDGS